MHSRGCCGTITFEFSTKTAEFYGLKHLGILNGVTFMGHQIGSSLSI